MRWQSSGRLVTLRSDATTGGPMVMLGTKCPSITSTWIRLAPPSSTQRISSARRAKSADRIEGASSIKGFSGKETLPMILPFPGSRIPAILLLTSLIEVKSREGPPAAQFAA